MKKKKAIGDCPLCNREMYDGLTVDEHHLIPREFNSRNKNKVHETVIIHRVCHMKIHSAFTNRELWSLYDTIDKLRESDEIKKFIKWVKKKDPEFVETSRESNDKKSRRRR